MVCEPAERPEVSVVIVTFNHAAYVRQAIDSVLSQKTNFAVELLISDDASTDDSRAILEERLRGSPLRVRWFVSATNLNTHEVTKRAWDAAAGRYICVLDGDDYWSSPHKLQRQRDFLEANPLYSACFHNTLLIWEDGRHPPGLNTPCNFSAMITEQDLWIKNMIAMSAIMYRRNLIGCLPVWYEAAVFGDWELHLIAAAHGPIAFIPEVMSVYRKHGAGIWTGMDAIKQYQKCEAAIEYAMKWFPVTEKALAHESNVLRMIRLARFYEEQGMPWRSWQCIGRALGWSLANARVRSIRLLSPVIRLKYLGLRSTLQKVWRRLRR